MSRHIIIGSRGSALALVQAKKVASLLHQRDTALTTEIKIIKTEGDLNQTSLLSEMGGKGVFIKAIEEALVNKEIDIAVHSLKDVTSALHESTELSAFLDPESCRDCLVYTSDNQVTHIDDIPKGATIATSSVRRKTLLALSRPDIVIKDIRGNVDTRIQKCEDGYADGLILSEAGLLRLNKKNRINISFEPTEFIPAPGQGVIAVQSRKDDAISASIVPQISHSEQQRRSQLELLLLHECGLGCDYPLGAYTQLNENRVNMRIFWATKKGGFPQYRVIEGQYNEMESLVKHIAQEIKKTI